MLHVDRQGRKGYAPRVAIALTIEEGPHEGITRAEVLRRIRAMIRLLQLDKAEVSFVLTDDKRVHELNKIYRGKDRPTDVLAFAMHEGEFGALAGHVLGDVIVSVPTARNQARSNRIPVLEEVTMLLAHGLLHLLGWDHETAAKDRLMRAETARLCAAAVPPTAKTVPSKEGADQALTRKPSATTPARRRKRPMT
jgi:probable rRNA maturation factor